ncbi:MBL fold metallo-hydrolase [Streptomyces sp. LP05-1]|uniref:MBL fold metallo-hydrolase n=1 Tax=Streptomyces pyxinae TaxID=2970734 RepID=A0ABT2CRY3_9ACTN|nr:MBL fold metallo-hydrolase [Streptomyces sp. LP05-1]MCS0639842.1 MBL fold metallo-hydrolase [Streptomyces sp. LP05-1]
MTTTEHLTLGDVDVIRVVEWQQPLLPARSLVPDSTGELWQEHREWLAPDHWDPAADRAVVALQSWVLRSGGRTILVDTGVGDGRDRPETPYFHHRKDGFLDRLAEAGIRPEDVDIVVNTHIHGDHVGWNTRDAGGEWVPAFPRAQYLIPAADDHHFGPAGGYGGAGRADDRLMYEDSVAPVHRAGQAVLWEGGHRIDEHLTLEPAPGHTPGSSVLRLASGSDRAVFVGDLIHSPVQLLAPSHNSCFCVDARESAATRRRVLGRAEAERELVFPAHFGGPGALEIRRHGQDFAPARWAEWHH